MLKIYEVYMVPGADIDALLSEEVKRETNAQIMTFEDAAKVGFSGLPDPGDKNARLIAVNPRDGAWIHRLLEGSELVSGFRTHDVDV